MTAGTSRFWAPVSPLRRAGQATVPETAAGAIRSPDPQAGDQPWPGKWGAEPAAGRPRPSRPDPAQAHSARGQAPRRPPRFGSRQTRLGPTAWRGEEPAVKAGCRTPAGTGPRPVPAHLLLRVHRHRCPPARRRHEPTSMPACRLSHPKIRCRSNASPEEARAARGRQAHQALIAASALPAGLAGYGSPVGPSAPGDWP